MGILYDRLLILLNESSSDSTFYHIALAMLQNMELLHSLAINEVADLCRVSKSTISKFIKNLVIPLPLSSIFHLFSSPFLPFHQSPGTVFYRHETEYLYEYDDYHQLYSLHPQNLLEKASESSTTPPEY